ncbi:MULTISPECIES: hypothetical protein [Kitasatospora]|uniref:hypothetical protein n=1 Tax=Kitasatospora TaxID=2063 RepID=UPI0011D20570|nr:MULTISPECIES: hypothetical protein [Kitasatospora]
MRAALSGCGAASFLTMETLRCIQGSGNKLVAIKVHRRSSRQQNRCNDPGGNATSGQVIVAMK